MTKDQRHSIYGESQKKFTNVFVKNFGDALDNEKFNEMFEKCGEVTSSFVAIGEDGKPKGFGFVNFKSVEGAEKVKDNFYFIAIIYFKKFDLI